MRPKKIERQLKRGAKMIRILSGGKNLNLCIFYFTLFDLNASGIISLMEAESGSN